MWQLDKRGNTGISIHALRVEGDPVRAGATQLPLGFLSTPSGWRATGLHSVIVFTAWISIHALRVEGDHNFTLRQFF